MCWVFFLKISSVLRPKSTDARAAFWGRCTAKTTTAETTIMVSESGAKTGKESGWLYRHLQNLMFFHNFFGFQKILKRQFLMMWCHNNDAFFFKSFPLMVQVQDCWVLPFYWFDFEGWCNSSCLAQNHHFWRIWVKNDEHGGRFGVSFCVEGSSRCEIDDNQVMVEIADWVHEEPFFYIWVLYVFVEIDKEKSHPKQQEESSHPKLTP